MRTVLLSTTTDPNGDKRTFVFQNGSSIFARKSQSRRAIEKAKDEARRAFKEAPSRAKLIRWDGDHKLKHTVATKE